MITKKHKILMWLFSALSAVLILAAYPFLPDQIPVNWGMNGAVDYGSKSNALLLGLLPFAMTVLLIFLPKIDPKKKNYQKFEKHYGSFGVFTIVFFFIMNLIILSESFRPGLISVGRVVSLLAGVMIIFIGNMMPKFKSTFFVGIRTPWTLSSTNVWNKTHRLGGALSFWGGILFCLCCLWLPEAAILAALLVLVLIAGLVPTIMSYVWYRRETADESEEE